MANPDDPPQAATPPPPLSPEDRRWLHDKYQRLASEEGELAASRTTYYAAIGTVLITGLVIAIDDFLNEPTLLAASVTFLAGLGIVISVVWVVLLHRTTDAQNLWREAALRVEEDVPPIEGVWRAPITLRSGKRVNLDLLRPYQSHAERFSPMRGVSWMDRLNPATLTEVLPIAFLGIWGSVLALIWVWWLILR